MPKSSNRPVIRSSEQIQKAMESITEPSIQQKHRFFTNLTVLYMADQSDTLDKQIENISPL